MFSKQVAASNLREPYKRPAIPKRKSCFKGPDIIALTLKDYLSQRISTREAIATIAHGLCDVKALRTGHESKRICKAYNKWLKNTPLSGHKNHKTVKKTISRNNNLKNKCRSALSSLVLVEESAQFAPEKECRRIS
ncbi:hypothetical protein MUP01_05005 [Candidatus Bathyarchaeota archaeon]|nr:hypothetical protein [Candidatus Bathyarchaeota archaeon]